MKLLPTTLACFVIIGNSLPAAAAVPPNGNLPAGRIFRAGAAAVDITPQKFPVRVNGGFLEASTEKVFDPLHARAVVLDDGAIRIALCVVDSCMMARELIDAAKAAAGRATGITVERMLVSATHTHTAPAAMPALGSRVDEAYAAVLPEKIAEAITAAAARLQPARVGWTTVDAWAQTNTRRWIRRPDKLITDPFGVASARANMHPGHGGAGVTGPSGPVDPGLSLLSIQTAAGRPLALLANFSMHYFGAKALSADYFGRFAEGVGRLIGASNEDGFVGIMSQGTSGDLQWRDYSQAAKPTSIDQYAESLMRLAADAYQRIEHREFADLAMAEAKLRLHRRVGNEARLAWARKLAETTGDRPPRNQPEVYAREQLFLAAEPERELKLQALRIGDLGITAIPNEVYGITGLKLKAQSPLRTTFNIELANGSEGYIPPPEQHELGGYTTWPARTAGLEVQAEPRIVETLLGLLEKVAGAARRPLVDAHGPYARAVQASKPAAFWRLNEINPPLAADASGRGVTAEYEPGIALYLPGAQAQGSSDAISAVPENPSAFSGTQINRAPHFAGGRVRARMPGLGRAYSVEMWLWNALPAGARPVAGYAFSRGRDGDAHSGEHLGITGTAVAGAADRLFFHPARALAPLVGRTALGLRSWHHVVLVRDGGNVRVYLDGNKTPELEGRVDASLAENDPMVFVGGRNDRSATFEGRIDEVAVYDRALEPDEIGAHFKASGRTPARDGR